MVDTRLIDALARVQGWRPCRDRFLKTNRQWIRRGQFQPTEDLQTAHEVLSRAGARYALTFRGALSLASVQIGERTARASNASPARALCLALAAALGLEESAR